MALNQPTPFRFKCSKCKSKSAVKVPGMMVIFLGVILFGILLGFGLFLTLKLGAFFFIPFIVLAVGIILTLQLWYLKYIAKFGTLTVIKTTKKDESADDDNYHR